MRDTLRFERLWTRAVGIFAAALILFFILTEFTGLTRLLEWLANGLAAAPAALNTVIAHYAALNPSTVILSLAIGGVFGAVSTAFMMLLANSVFTPNKVGFSPPLHERSAVARGSGGEVFGSPAAPFVAPTTPARRIRMAGIGAILGAVGGQIIPLGLSHCTYLPEAPPVEAAAGVVLTALSTLVLLLPAWTLMRGRASSGASGTFRHRWGAYLLLAPTLLSLLVFLYYPSVQMVSLSLNLRRFPLPQTRFVCLGNYTALASDLIYQNSFITTLAITAAIVLMSLALALCVAVLASQKVRFIAVYRAFLIFPFALSPIVTGVIFLALFREGTTGILSYAMMQVFGSAPNWLRDPSTARWVIVAASVWNILGFNILFYIAGLQNVPKDLLDAAHIDGANAVQRFFRVTFPLLSPYTFFLLITNVTYGFYGIYGAVDALTQGGPPLGAAGQFGGATDMLIYKLYEDAFNPGAPVGMAAAQAVVLFALVAGLTLLQFKQVERRVTYGE